MGIASGLKGAVDFTLHIGDSGIQYGMNHGEMRFAVRLYRRIKDRLTCASRELGIPSPDFAFMVEQGIGERPHLHGFIILPGSRQHRERLREALCEAVGRDWKPTGSDRTQLEIGTFYEPAGWVSYMHKFSRLTKKTIGDNIFACSREITIIGREWYEEMRRSRGLLMPGKALPIVSACCPTGTP